MANSTRMQTMEAEKLQAKMTEIEGKREYLLKLLERPNLGTLRIDVNQAIEELDDLIMEFKRTFPD
ncbi:MULTISPECIES: hypothetical protein [Planktothricoides]|uniref:Uncharacterized protein n=2 Tax=Planktothricoides raciborskii TaxID=132608 RepID=A0AAU8JM01_9CYAN|nr:MULTISPECIES: hypothetical protein [Planktothricoides]MBD2583764.1 hypothetical protein [Planktothricoides raciborskii FACHB-1261]